MAFKRGLMAVALGALAAACASAPEQAAPQAIAAPGVYAGRSVLDAAIEVAGGQAALSKAKELEWTGTATVTAEGKTTKINVMTVLRPATNWSRTTSWTDADGPKKARTIQTEQGKGWTVNGVTWTPMQEAQAAHENQQFSLYKMMLLTPLKETGVTVSENPPGAEGARSINAQLAGGVPARLTFDATGKLAGVELSVRDAKGGPDIKETVKLSGELVSNGVKWPKQISISQNGHPYFDLELATFEATPDLKPRPLPHTLDDGQTPPQDRPADAG
ncbi:MAG: hypothetical protein QM773_06215 [Hyphomonadaceae bacterium]